LWLSDTNSPISALREANHQESDSHNRRNQLHPAAWPQ
jgi:hypothetical protein